MPARRVPTVYMCMTIWCSVYAGCQQKPILPSEHLPKMASFAGCLACGAMDILKCTVWECRWREGEQLATSCINTEPAVWAQLLTWLTDHACLAMQWLQQANSQHTEQATYRLLWVVDLANYFSDCDPKLQARSLALPSYRKMLMQLSSWRADSWNRRSQAYANQCALSALLQRHDVSYIHPQLEEDMALELMPASIHLIRELTDLLTEDCLIRQGDVADGSKQPCSPRLSETLRRLAWAVQSAYHCTYLPACDDTFMELQKPDMPKDADHHPEATAVQSSDVMTDGVTQATTAMADADLSTCGSSVLSTDQSTQSLLGSSKRNTFDPEVFIPGVKVLLQHSDSFAALEACLRCVGRSWVTVDNMEEGSEPEIVEQISDIITAACQVKLRLPPLQSLVASLTKVLTHGRFAAYLLQHPHAEQP